MLEQAFQDVYTKFKLHFYQNVFSAFCHTGSHADHGGVLLHGGHHGYGRTYHCGVFPHDADLHPQRGV